jgi:YHS domain-containing protein
MLLISLNNIQIKEKSIMRLTPKNKVNIINAYENQLIPMQVLARQYNVGRQAIWKMLRASGVNTTKHQILVSCSTCAKEIKRHKYRIRKNLHHFCSEACYRAFLEAGNGNPYIGNRQGQRIARKKVAEHFELQPGHIVHHEDRNTLNNMLHNLRVFRNQGDHVRYHRGLIVGVLWNGNNL